MKKAILFFIAAISLAAIFTATALAAPFIRSYNADDFKINPGADIKLIDDSATYNKKAIQGLTRDDDAAKEFATLSIDVPAAGKYYVWAMTYATSTSDNSLYFSIDGQQRFTWDYMEIEVEHEDYDTYPYYSAWYWMYLTNRDYAIETLGISSDGHVHIATGLRYVLELSAGSHEIKLITREPEAKYDALLITDDENYDPNKDPKLAINIDPKTVYSAEIDAANEAAAKAAAEAEAAAQAQAEADAAAAQAAADAAANAPAPAPTPAPAAQSPQTGDMAALWLICLAAALAYAVLAPRKGGTKA